MDKHQKVMISGLLTVLLGTLSIMMLLPSNLFFGEILKALLPGIIYYILIFGLAILSGIFFAIGLSFIIFQEEEEQPKRKKKLFQIYFLALFFLTIFTLLIIFIPNFENKIA